MVEIVPGRFVVFEIPSIRAVYVAPLGMGFPVSLWKMTL